MNELLIHSAQQLAEDEAGGHGDRSAVFDEDVADLFGRWLGVSIESGTLPNWNVRPRLLLMCAEEDLVLPIYLAEGLFDGDWRPEVGQYVTGRFWMQAYATARVRSNQ